MTLPPDEVMIQMADAMVDFHSFMTTPLETVRKGHPVRISVLKRVLHAAEQMGWILTPKEPQP